MDPMDAALEAISEAADTTYWGKARYEAYLDRVFDLMSAIPHRSTWERNLAEFGKAEQIWSGEERRWHDVHPTDGSAWVDRRQIGVRTWRTDLAEDR